MDCDHSGLPRSSLRSRCRLSVIKARKDLVTSEFVSLEEERFNESGGRKRGPESFTSADIGGVKTEANRNVSPTSGSHRSWRLQRAMQLWGREESCNSHTSASLVNVSLPRVNWIFSILVINKSYPCTALVTVRDNNAAMSHVLRRSCAALLLDAI